MSDPLPLVPSPAPGWHRRASLVPVVVRGLVTPDATAPHSPQLLNKLKHS